MKVEVASADVHVELHAVDAGLLRHRSLRAEEVVLAAADNVATIRFVGTIESYNILTFISKIIFALVRG